MRIIKGWLLKQLIIALFGFCGAVHANNTNYGNNTNEVWLFGTKEQRFTQAHKISNHWKIKHYHIDGGKHFEAKISQGLSNNKAVATKQLRQRFKQYKNKWALEARRAWQGAINAQSLPIDKVPAISFDKGKTLIYGVTDLLKALNIHRQAKSRQQNKPRGL